MAAKWYPSWYDGGLATRRQGTARKNVCCRAQRIGVSVAANASAQERSKHGTAKEAGSMAVKTAEQVLAPKPKVVSKEHFGELQRILDGKTSSLRKTYKTQSEANDKVWMLNENTEGVGHVRYVTKSASRQPTRTSATLTKVGCRVRVLQLCSSFSFGWCCFPHQRSFGCWCFPLSFCGCGGLFFRF